MHLRLLRLMLVGDAQACHGFVRNCLRDSEAFGWEVEWRMVAGSTQLVGDLEARLVGELEAQLVPHLVVLCLSDEHKLGPWCDLAVRLSERPNRHRFFAAAAHLRRPSAATLVALLRSGCAVVLDCEDAPESRLAQLEAACKALFRGCQLQARLVSLETEVSQLRQMLATDDLTQLASMKHFLARLRQEFIRAQRYHKQLSLVMLDLDHFKQVNDRHDHLMGSYVLGEVGKRIAAKIRFLDLAGRYGGDEFILLLPETGEEGAIATAERVRLSLSEQLFDDGRRQVQVQASFGVATLRPAAHPHFVYGGPEDLVRLADFFLYEAKESGRNCIVSHGSTTRYRDAATLEQIMGWPGGGS